MDTRKTLEEVREEIANLSEYEFWNRLRNAKDAYQVAVRLLSKGKIKKLIREDPRVIECTPVAILNNRFNLEDLANQSIKEGVQNQFCYLLKETEKVALRFRRSFEIDKVINYLLERLNSDIKPLGSYPPKKPETNTQIICRIRCGRYNFFEQYEVYRRYDRSAA